MQNKGRSAFRDMKSRLPSEIRRNGGASHLQSGSSFDKDFDGGHARSAPSSPVMNRSSRKLSISGSGSDASSTGSNGLVLTGGGGNLARNNTDLNLKA